jgi:hypothetical protein
MLATSAVAHAWQATDASIAMPTQSMRARKRYATIVRCCGHSTRPTERQRRSLFLGSSLAFLFWCLPTRESSWKLPHVSMSLGTCPVLRRNVMRGRTVDVIMSWNGMQRLRHRGAPADTAGAESTDDARTRFALELEFVQCLSRIDYLQCVLSESCMETPVADESWLQGLPSKGT